MKIHYPFLLCFLKRYSAWFILVFLYSTSYSQTQLAFTGTPVVSGTAGAINTTYTYNNIGTMGSVTIRGVIKITAKSGGASLYTIDASSGGSSNAWQPVVNGPSTSNGSCWGITFEVSFYNASTGDPLTLSTFRANGIDIDGDGGNLREYNEPYNLSSYTVENPTSLTVTSVPGGFHFRSPQTAYNGILLNQTNVAATWYYENTHAMSIKIGSCCVGGTCSATGSGNRQSSINFYDAVAYNVGNTVLPVEFSKITGQSLGAKNRISWQVNRQVNVVRYIVQKSTSPTAAFKEVGTIEAKISDEENIFYQFDDESTEPVSYYRVTGVNKDGKLKYSSTIRVSQSATLNSLKVFNKPAGTPVQFELHSSGDDDMVLKILNQDGKIEHVENFRARKGIMQYTVHNFAIRRKGGIYILHLKGNKGVTYLSKIVAW